MSNKETETKYTNAYKVITEEVMRAMSDLLGREVTIETMSDDELNYAIALSEEVSYHILFQGDTGSTSEAARRFGVSRKRVANVGMRRSSLYRNGGTFRVMAKILVDNLSRDFAVERHCKLRSVKLRFIERQLALLNERREQIIGQHGN